MSDRRLGLLRKLNCVVDSDALLFLRCVRECVYDDGRVANCLLAYFDLMQHVIHVVCRVTRGFVGEKLKRDWSIRRFWGDSL